MAALVSNAGSRGMGSPSLSSNPCLAGRACHRRLRCGQVTPGT